jgi:putative transposase
MSGAVVVTTDSNHKLPVYPNLARSGGDGFEPALGGRFDVHPIAVWFVFLAVILDAFSRRVIRWALARTLEATLTMGR